MNSVRVSLMFAKTKVAPLKVQSVPRLELCGALLLAKAIEFVSKSLHLTQVPIFCWTDSSVVLSWLNSIPSRWTTFVANRVSEILTIVPNATWRHVPTDSNPADCASRGISTESLLSHPLWWSGPSWLKNSESEWPSRKINTTTDHERRGNACVHVTKSQFQWNLPDEVSSWPKILRITAYVLRFTYNTRHKHSRILNKHLIAAEITKAKYFWVKAVQAYHFGKELSALQKKESINMRSVLLSLSPFLDDAGILRVGGRLRFADMSDDSKFPIILPKCRISELLIQHMHIRSLHGGIQSTLRVLRQHFWILSARSQVKASIFKCITCTRQRASVASQRMADLPKVRVRPARPFANSGVDYAGPFHIRTAKGRGQKTHKAYCILFVCLATRAIHLEIADDYTTDGFIAAFERFSARRGIPVVIYSDNGTNLQGADRELSSRIREIMNDSTLQNRFAVDEITWRFIPPAAPHFGGIWEAGVKSVKYHLRRILGDFTPTFEEFSTLLCKIECILNSRPLAPLFDDPENFDALTPGHFLVGSNLMAVPSVSVSDISINRLSRWQTIQRLQETFWKIWSADYLNSLQQRNKWNIAQPSLQIGDLVLLRNTNLPPARWELGRVLQCHPGADKLVRVVTIKTARSTLKRPITQLCKLPIDARKDQTD